MPKISNKNLYSKANLEFLNCNAEENRKDNFLIKGYVKTKYGNEFIQVLTINAPSTLP